MVKLILPTLDKIVRKWVEEAPKRATYYQAEATVAGDEWERGAIAAAGTYKAAVSVPIIDKLFSGGIKRVGGKKYERKVRDVGVARFGPGITAAEEDYRSGFDPFLAELARIDIPERKPRGDPANYDIVRKIGEPLHKKRLALRAALIGM